MSDYESDYAAGTSLLPTRSRSLVAQTEIIHSSEGNAYHINKESILQDLAEKQFPLEDSELIFKSFDEAEDGNHFAASYLHGCLLRRVIPDAWMPTVSIVFMPGLDKMSVNQAEQQDMTREEPRQRSARWRVLTAGTFLTNLEFDDNLTLSRIDQTPSVLGDMRRRDSSISKENSTGTALFKVARDDGVMTIDSDNVKIVSSLKPGDTDLEATLIEVDKSSLFNLVIDFHRIVRDGGAALNTDLDSRVKLLEVMIEDARRLAVRSPILFRQSTRQQIARSRNTRYGVNHGSMFETITTSVGIKNIISKSVACFDSLAVLGENNDDQRLVRPKFLQMLVLLLSLLNDADLRTIAPVLEKTYRIRPDRTSIELLILKVLPLQSINKTIFVREMVTAVGRAPDRFPESEEKVWNNFIADLINLGYVLPGFTTQIGQFNQSWLVKFPEGDGFKDSYVFNNLQYCDKYAAINEIPAMDFGMHQKSGEVTSVLTNGKRYLIDVNDHQKITSMIYGNYSVCEATSQKRSCDLTISEVFVNDFLNRAIQKTNHVFGIVNSYFAKVKINRWEWASRRARPKPFRHPDIASCGRLTSHEARLNGHLLAVAYKVEGKKIARRDLIRNLAADVRKVKTTLHYISLEIQRHDGRRVSEETRLTIAALQGAIPEIQQCLGYAEQNKQALENAHLDIGDEPIVQTIYPGGVANKGVVHWSPYRMRLIDGTRSLRIEAYRRTVARVRWVTEEIAEVYLADPLFPNSAKQFFVSPLKRVLPEEQQWEIRQGDAVIMVGQYVVVVMDEEEGEIELPAHVPEPQLYGNNGPIPKNNGTARPTNGGRKKTAGGMNAQGQRFVAPRPPPQIFANWMRVVGVQQGQADPRNHLRQRQNDMTEGVFH